MSKQVRRYAFTSFKVEEPTWNKELFNYMIYGKEVCPDTKKEHWQGYVEYHNKTGKSLKKIAKDINCDHVESCYASQDANLKYCKKDGSWKEFGTKMVQGKRNDLKSLYEAKTIGEVDDELILKFPRGVESVFYYKRKPPKRNWMTELHIFWGPTRTGKSHMANMLGGEDAYWKPPGKWWDFYMGQEIVILDEWYEHQLPREDMLRLVDKYPFYVEPKSKVVPFLAKKIILTSNSDPSKWYNSDPAWLERITSITKLDKRDKCPDNKVVAPEPPEGVLNQQK